MTEFDSQAVRRRRARLTIGGLLLVALAVVLAVTLGRGGDGTPQPAQGPSAASATPPPYPVAPVSTVDDVTLTVPEETRFAHGTFWATADTTYVVTFDLRSTKPEGSGGRS